MATPTSLPDAPPVPHLDTEQLQSAYGKEILGHREPVTALAEPPRYQKAAAHQFLQTPPTISISKTRSESNMHRGFSFRRANSNAGPKAVTEKPLPVMPGHSRNHSIQSAASWQQNGALLPGPSSGGLQRSMSKRQKFVRAITNPDKIFDRDPASPPPESRFNPNPNSKLARTFFGNGRVDFGSGAPVAPPTPPTPSIPLPDLEEPLFNSDWISEKVEADLPSGYTLRPMCRGDYGRGYMDVLRVVGRTGWVGEDVWEERCEWLRTMSSTYFILVVVNSEDRIVASGTLMMERKFVHNLGTVGHVEDIAVARDQKGKKMGLRVLEALVHVAQTAGCYKTMVNCAEANEAFHAQCGFVREGSQMMLHHSSRKPTQEHWV
ncbi:hypothetical protein EG327_011200 [Venturia inaequalis]|uniref:Glucosamine 6-phosphate N-acetyltransferase n=1 Tax=Venturia inaequalis TaxID=5025 RepID=A0A8H3UG34_VENIN|nr:hypothetical protein EG327_011200 [Venturia inaequalis]